VVKRQVSISKREESNKRIYVSFISSPRKDSTRLRWINAEILSSLKLLPFDYSASEVLCSHGTCSLVRTRIPRIGYPRTCRYFGPGAWCPSMSAMAGTVFRSASPFHRELESQDSLAALRFCELRFSGGVRKTEENPLNRSS